MGLTPSVLPMNSFGHLKEMETRSAYLRKAPDLMREDLLEVVSESDEEEEEDELLRLWRRLCFLLCL